MILSIMDNMMSASFKTSQSIRNDLIVSNVTIKLMTVHIKDILSVIEALLLL